MTKVKGTISRTALVCATLLALTETALAYTGPGAGLTAIGSLLALVATILFALVGFVWYPIKRFMKSRRKASEEKTTPAAQ